MRPTITDIEQQHYDMHTNRDNITSKGREIGRKQYNDMQTDRQSDSDRQRDMRLRQNTTHMQSKLAEANLSTG